MANQKYTAEFQEEAVRQVLDRGYSVKEVAENTNRLLRQYFPKGQSIDGFTQRQLNAVARELNERPRQTLNFSTPAEILNGALTG